VVDIAKDQTVSDLFPPTSLRARVESSLASAIISGELQPGTMMSVPVLAAQFEVSITPVREAMLHLEDRGFVESVKNKGFRVTEVSARDLREIAQLRYWLEAPAMRVVAERLQGQSLERFREMACRVSKSAASGDREEGLADRHPSEEILHSANEHVDLLDLLALGDGEGAERFMARHIGHMLG
jgi:DNA-binding GntR family transcriptional regulator